jgi:hypothetical protein
MLQGVEGELHVAFDSLLSSARVVDVLTAFSGEFPTVKLYLHVETLGAVASLVLEKTSIIGISGQRTEDFHELRRISVGSLRMVPVAGAHHPLASASRPPTWRRSGTRAACRLRPLAAHQGQGFQRDRHPHLAARRPLRQAHAIAGRNRIGSDASCDRRAPASAERRMAGRRRLPALHRLARVGTRQNEARVDRAVQSGLAVLL